MKFGKRLRRECHVEWVTYYLDYKELKKIIKNTVASGSDSRVFFDMLECELDKLNDFFCGRVALFEEMFPFMAGRLQKGDPKIDSFMQWCEGLDHLRKYVVLNYIAVRKIVKKFDKNTNNTTPVPPILAKQPFYNSVSLAKLITKTEIMVAKHNGTNLADSFLCPVCLEILHAPVVLSCAHIFCWSCLARAAQFTCNNACPVCRKEVPLDPTAYKVDSLLQRFLSQNLPEQVQRKGFGYFFQTPPPPRNLKVILAPARFTTPQHAARFSAHCNARHTDAQFCVFADNSPSYKQAVQLNSSKIMFVDTQVDPLALRKGETLVPYVESEGENALGKVLVVGFRVGLPGAGKPVYEKQVGQSRTALVFMKYLPFDQLEKTTFDKLLKKHANGLKYLFILDAPQAQTGMWNNIPFAKLPAGTHVVETKPTEKLPFSLPFPPTPVPILIPYQEIFIKKDNILVHERCFVDEPPHPRPHLGSSKASLDAFLDTHPNAHLDAHPNNQALLDPPAASTKTPTSSPKPPPPHAIDTLPFPTGGSVGAFEDGVWSVVWRTYLVLLLAALYYLLVM